MQHFHILPHLSPIYRSELLLQIMICIPCIFCICIFRYIPFYLFQIYLLWVPFKLLFSNKYTNIKIHRYTSLYGYIHYSISIYWRIYPQLPLQFSRTIVGSLTNKYLWLDCWEHDRGFCKVNNLHLQDFHFKQALLNTRTSWSEVRRLKSKHKECRHGIRVI